jgi:hypothetical protein
MRVFRLNKINDPEALEEEFAHVLAVFSSAPSPEPRMIHVPQARHATRRQRPRRRCHCQWLLGVAIQMLIARNRSERAQRQTLHL